MALLALFSLSASPQSEQGQLHPGAGWLLGGRVGKFGEITGCPAGQRNAAQSECSDAVREAAQRAGLQVYGFKVVHDGPDGRIPTGCSYSRSSSIALFNRHPNEQQNSRADGKIYDLACIEASPADTQGTAGKGLLTHGLPSLSAAVALTGETETRRTASGSEATPAVKPQGDELALSRAASWLRAPRSAVAA